MHFDAFKILKAHLLATDSHFQFKLTIRHQKKFFQFAIFTPLNFFLGNILLPTVNAVDATDCVVKFV